MYTIPFHILDWNNVPATRHAGETGYAMWHTREYDDLRIRLVEYSPGYRADHWCERGHILLCLEGQLDTELADGTTVRLEPGMSYQVSDGLSRHRSTTNTGAKLFIVDGGFLRGTTQPPAA
ncbi:MAG: DHCW motif cupin fold protein [Cyclobacteriaceae bacterium]|nr:DHCW motif cupin fold protein [Cyclobacteriaceae bacterium]